jgi:hypothetical protein
MWMWLVRAGIAVEEERRPSLRGRRGVPYLLHGILSSLDYTPPPPPRRPPPRRPARARHEEQCFSISFSIMSPVPMQC